LLSLPLLRAFALSLFASLFLPAVATAQSPTGGTEYPPPAPPLPATAANMTVPGVKARLLPDGSAAAPADAPAQVQQAIWAANRLQDKPYKYGGGHARVEDTGYDCSGTVSYALFHGGLLETPLDSGSFMRWGEPGRGAWLTVYTNPGHAYAVIAGLRLDTSSHGVSARRSRSTVARSAFERGPRWRPTKRSSRGFRARHPIGL
jgi:hypothetical protein